jgi:hypothetical protein
LLRKQANSLHRTLAGLLGATALANLANGVSLLDEAHALGNPFLEFLELARMFLPVLESQA